MLQPTGMPARRLIVLLLLCLMAGVLTGTAQALTPPEIEVWYNGQNLADGTTLTFPKMTEMGSTALSFTVKNTGQQALTGLALTKSGPQAAGIGIDAPGLPASVKAAGSATIQGWFHNLVPGLNTATLSIASNDANENPFDITLSCIVERTLMSVDPPSGFGSVGYVNFTGVVPGQAGTAAFTINNDGETTLTSIVAEMISGQTDFAITQAPPATLAPGLSTEVIVSFSPTRHFERVGSLRIRRTTDTYNIYNYTLRGEALAPRITVTNSVSGGSFNPAHVGTDGETKSFEIGNAGLADLAGLAVTLQGTNPGEFEISRQIDGAVVAPGGPRKRVDVRFKPTAVGYRSAELVIASNDPFVSSVVIPLSGYGSVPEIYVTDGNDVELPSGSVINFGSQEVRGGSATRRIKVKNLGQGYLTYTSYAESPGPGWPEFGNVERWWGTSNAVVNDVVIIYPYPQEPILYRVLPDPNGQQMDLFFNPASQGPKTTRYVIHSIDLDEPVYEFTLTGTGTEVLMAVEQPAGTPLPNQQSRDLGTVAVGTSASFTLTLTNPGTAPLIPSASFVGNLRGGFSLSSLPASIPPGGSAECTVQFAPPGTTTYQATLHIASNVVPGKQDDTFDITLTGTGANSVIAFASEVIQARHGDSVARVTLTRQHAQIPATIRLFTGDGAASAGTSFTGAVAGIDYTPLAGQGALVSFATGEAEKTVEIPLLSPPAARATTSRQFQLSLGWPSAGAEMKLPGQATVRILGTGSAKPTLLLKTPAAGKLSDLLPMLVTGIAGDDQALDRVEVKLDAADPVLAALGTTNDPKAVPFSCQLAPADGSHVLTITAYDTWQNATAVTRTFTFTRKYPFTVEMRDVGTGELIANAASLAVTYTGGTPLVPSQPTAATRTTALVDGTAVKIVATPAKGYAIHHWSHTPLGPPQANIFTYGNIASFATLAGPQVNQSTTVQLWLMPTPFSPPVGASNTLYWYLPPDPLSPSTKPAASLSATVSPSGSFTCKLIQSGVTYNMAGFFLGSGHALLIYKGHYITGIIFSGRTLRLRTFDGMTAPEAGFDSYTGPANIPWVPGRWGRYSATNKVPNQGLNPPAFAKGSYTMSLKPSDRLQPLPTALPYPQGAGYASWTLTPLGQATLTGALADGTTFTSSTTLVRGAVNADEIAAPVFLELAPLGSTKKSSVLAGDAIFDFSTTATVNGDFFWQRPASTVVTTAPYSQGWPQGFYLAGAGRMYLASQDLQTALMLGPYVPGQANASLTFSHGGLTSSVTKSSFAIHKNAIIKVPPADASYTLTIAPATGLVTGTFTPNWPDPSATKPAFKGILVQGQGAQGFFLNNTKYPPADGDASGTVILSSP